MNRSASATLSSGLVLFTKHCTVTLVTQGSATSGERILATAFGLSSIEESSAFCKTDDAALYLAAPCNDRSYVILKAEAAVTPLAVSGAFNCVVKGY